MALSTLGLVLVTACASAPPVASDAPPLVLGRGAAGGPLPAPPAASSVSATSADPSQQTGMADQQHGAPWTPALRALQGRVPLVSVTMTATSTQADQIPSLQFAVFDDGTIAYEGDRCVKVGGLVITHMSADDLRGLREYLATACAVDAPAAAASEGAAGDHGEEGAPHGEEICPQAEQQIHVACATGKQLSSTTERCHDGDHAPAKALVLARELAKHVRVDEWIGAPPERQACERGANALGTGELKTITSKTELSDPRFANRP